jgi:hypothetical protein
MYLGFEPFYLGIVARIANHYNNRLISAFENVKYIYYFTDELFYKRLVFWFIEAPTIGDQPCNWLLRIFTFH